MTFCLSNQLLQTSSSKLPLWDLVLGTEFGQNILRERVFGFNAACAEHGSCLGSLKAPLEESMLTCLAWWYNSMLLRKFLLKLPLAANGFEYGVFSSFEGGMGKHISRYSQ